VTEATTPPSDPADDQAGPAAAGDERAPVHALAELQRLTARHGFKGQRWSDEELLRLPRLYRRACTLLTSLETGGGSVAQIDRARKAVAAGHALLHREARGTGRNALLRLIDYLSIECPRAIRSEWRLLVFSLLLFYGLAAAAWIGVAGNLDLAPSLLDQKMVASQIDQLESTPTDEPFRGNFNFGLGESPGTAGMLMAHNIGVGLLFFAAALVPPFYLYVLLTNALMLGTYTGVAGHWGQAGSISSILWCHGVLEIQALILAATAGLVLVRAWIRPGFHTRRHAMLVEGKQASRLLVPVFPLLVCAGIIEAFISPHAPFSIRLATAITTGVLLVGWVLLGGRRGDAGAPTPGTAART